MTILKTSIEIEKLAKEFSDLLAREIGIMAIREVQRKNAEWPDSDVCHSHDFCDANMVMHEAGKNLKLWDDDSDMEVIMALWNPAWDLAVEQKFYI